VCKGKMSKEVSDTQTEGELKSYYGGERNHLTWMLAEGGSYASPMGLCLAKREGINGANV